MKASFGPSRQVEIAYETAIRKLLESVLPPRKPGQDFADWIAELAQLSNETFFAPAAEHLARQMVAWSNVKNSASWKEAAARSQRSRMLYRVLQKELSGPIGQRYDSIIRQNADLIRSIPNDVAVRLTAHLAKAQQAGMRAESLHTLLREEFPRLTGNKIRLIARTEVAKAASALTEAKSRDLGLGWAEWQTSQDQRVRPSHRFMNGVLISWDDPPSPEALVGEKSSLGRYLPGCCPNCRCGSLPLLTVDDVSWPRRAYVGGRIVRFTRQQFMQFSGIGERVAA